jgi:putative flippase GtrA
MRALAGLWSALPPHRRALIGQLVRYAVVGFGVTSLQALVYWLLAEAANVHSQIANFAGYLCAVASGYVLHGRYTFGGTPRLEGGAAHVARGSRFVIASLVSWGLNALWVWLCVSWREWPTWSQIPAMLFVTPALVFVLNKKWVFR